MVDFAGDKKVSHGGERGPTFADIVGQDELKEALLAVAANDDLDGLLIRGEKGTAKSTAVRALADLLPAQRAIADCPYGCPPADPARQCGECRDRTDPPTEERRPPLVTLPLGATRERVVGSLSVADALDGAYEFDPGLLARANRGILYVDEVNLLEDHLVDVLLDAAASGVNRVERDGVSVAHPAEFTLIGTMNPEEGDLRPQLRDRFALQATVTGCADLDDRVAIIEQNLNPRERDEAEGGAGPARRLRQARDLLATDGVTLEQTRTIAALCRDAGVDGHRADIAIARTARTFAALADREIVVKDDLERAAALALPHRLQSRPFEDPPDAEDVIDEHFEDEEPDESQGEDPSQDGDEGAESEDARRDAGGGSGESGGEEGTSDGSGTDGPGVGTGGEAEEERDSSGDDPADDPPAQTGEPPAESPPEDTPDGSVSTASGGSGGGEDGNLDTTSGEASEGQDERQPVAPPTIPGQQPAEIGEADAPDLPTGDALDGATGTCGSRRASETTVGGDGPRVRTRPADTSSDLDAASSVRAAAARGGGAVESRDLRQSVRRDAAAALVVFAVDASASMRPAMQAAKGTVLELLQEAYEHRDEVAFVAFAGDSPDVLLPPTDSVTLAARHLKDLPSGDRTPLPAGLETAGTVIERADPATSVLVLVTDGRANVPEGSTVEATRTEARAAGEIADRVLVVDAGDGGRAGLADVVADAAGGDCVPLATLTADGIDAAVGAARGVE
jgi:magnesium chelatase subunit D